jgi:hypothetical protein
MEFTIRVRRPQVALVAIATLMALLVPAAVDVAASGSPTPLATVYTRSASCAGVNFYPQRSDTGYTTVGTARFRTDAVGNGYFMCNPGLPTGAVVTKVQFTRQAPPPGASATKNCGLQRVGLTTSTATHAEVMARVPGSEEITHHGLVRQTDSSIAHATVDNSRYAYYLQCQLIADPSFLPSAGIYGANVIYTISASKG